ncbi:Rho termination factor N-terminal domain-containing protein [Paenibacillus sp. y28]
MPDPDAMTKAELLQYAADHGVNGLMSTMLKADIIAAIKGAMGWT